MKRNTIGRSWFDAVKSFKEKEGRWPRRYKAEDKREVVLADGKPVLKDLATWMSDQKTYKSNGKLIPSREKKLNEIGFPFHSDRWEQQQQQQQQQQYQHQSALHDHQNEEGGGRK